MLKIRRSRIAKKAQAKIDIAKRVVSDHYELGQHWLVYCEDQDQLYAVATAIAKTGIAPWVYHSEMEGDPDATLAAYRRESGVLVSIRCLDEGVDIPEISHAVILASSQNPRQFIQRRGRVLRRSPGKLRANIWDALVLPPNMAHDIHGSLTRSELLRAIEFAENAANQGGDVSALRQLAIDLGMSVDEIYGLAEVAEEDE
jgi:superfamily II DNA or RNA helicase